MNESHDATFDLLRQRARERGEALRAAELADLAAARATADGDDDEADIVAPITAPELQANLPYPPAPPPSVRGTMVARRLSSLARMLGLPSDAPRAEIQAAIDQLSRSDLRAEMRHRLGGGA